MSSMSISNTSLNETLRTAIRGTYDTPDVHTFCDYLMGASSVAVAAHDLLAYIAAAQDAKGRFILHVVHIVFHEVPSSGLAGKLFGAIGVRLLCNSQITGINVPKLEARLDVVLQIFALAIDHPFFSQALAELVVAISYTPDEKAAAFRSTCTRQLGDLSQSRWANLQYKQVDAAETVNLNGFMARLLNIAGHVEEPSERIEGLDDALFIIVSALEDESSGAEVTCAAQYFLFATRRVRNACVVRLGREQAATSPLWACKGSMWTGELGYGTERWDFWRERLQSLGGENGLKGAGRELSVRAGLAMNLVE